MQFDMGISKAERLQGGSGCREADVANQVSMSSRH